MTVAELIEHLETLPQDYLVVYRSCSDMNVLEANQIEITRGVKHHNLPDTVRDYNEWEWRPGTMVWHCNKCGWITYCEGLCPRCKMLMSREEKRPCFVNVVQFPGN